jgi:hypothetical protein
MNVSSRSSFSHLYHPSQKQVSKYKVLINLAKRDKEIVNLLYERIVSPSPTPRFRFMIMNLMLGAQKSKRINFKIKSVFNKVIIKAGSSLFYAEMPPLILEIFDFLLNNDLQSFLFLAQSLIYKKWNPVFVCAELCRIIPEKELESITWMKLNPEEIFEYAIKYPDKIGRDKYYLRNQEEIIQDQISWFKEGIKREVSTGFDEGLCFGYACAALLGRGASLSEARYYQAFHLLNLKTKESYEQVEFPKLKRPEGTLSVGVDEPSYPIKDFYKHLQSLEGKEIFLSLESEEASHLLYVNFEEKSISDNGEKHNPPPGVDFKLFLNAYVHLEYLYPCTHFGCLPITFI